jgi:hypothetical protein
VGERLALPWSSQKCSLLFKFHPFEGNANQHLTKVPAQKYPTLATRHFEEGSPILVPICKVNHIRQDTADLGSVHFPGKSKQTIRRLVDSSGKNFVQTDSHSVLVQKYSFLKRFLRRTNQLID